MSEPTKRPKKVIKAFIDAAIAGIETGDLESTFCSAKRARTKLKRLMRPTPKQWTLLRFIWMRTGNISYEDTLGMNWTLLGGLFTRGYVTLQKVKDSETMRTKVILRVDDDLILNKEYQPRR